MRQFNKIMLFIMMFSLVSVGWLNAQKAPSTVKIKKEHPRLFLTREDISRLQNNPPKLGDTTVEIALQYLLTKNSDIGRKAVEKIKTEKDIINCATAYDWAYNAMSSKERIELADYILSQPVKLSMNAPTHNFTYSGAFKGIIKALAIYGETSKPEEEKKEFERFWKLWDEEDGVIALYEFLKDGGWYESMDYLRHTTDIAAMAFAGIDTAIIGGEYFKKLEYLKNCGYFTIYCLRPDQTFYIFGDNDYPGLIDWDRRMMLVLANKYKNPHFQWWLNHIVPNFKGHPRNLFFDLIYYNSNQQEKSWKDLPLAHLFNGVGIAVFRSGWELEQNGEDNNIWMAFKCSDWYGAHQHADANSFVVYKKGSLAVDTGAYCDAYESDHWTSYYCRTIAHNSVLVNMPGESWKNKADGIGVNDGGQLCPWSGRFAMTIKEWLAFSKSQRDVGEIPC